MIGFSTKLHATAAAHNFAPPASPEKGITLCRKGTHQPLMPRQGGGSARSASSFVFNWDKINGFVRKSAFRVLLRTFALHFCSWPETPVPAADLDDGDTSHYYYQ